MISPDLKTSLHICKGTSLFQKEKESEPKCSSAIEYPYVFCFLESPHSCSLYPDSNNEFGLKTVTQVHFPISYYLHFKYGTVKAQTG